MGRYEELCKIEVLEPIIPILRPRPAWIDADGVVQLYQKILPGSPWMQIRARTDRSCGKWKAIYFDYYKIVPEGCRHCWKVVWTGTTLDQLYKVKEIQEDMNVISKCGVETRPSSGKLGHYQAFWYSSMKGGLDGARKLHREVADRFAKDKFLGGTEIILKRGCTEMEHYYSPSDSWDKLAEMMGWDRKEKLLDSSFTAPVSTQEGGALKTTTEKKWIEYAWEHKDPTVTKEYPNKYLERSLIPQLLQYQRSVHSGRDYIGWEGSDEEVGS